MTLIYICTCVTCVYIYKKYNIIIYGNSNNNDDDEILCLLHPFVVFHTLPSSSHVEFLSFYIVIFPYFLFWCFILCQASSFIHLLLFIGIYQKNIARIPWWNIFCAFCYFSKSWKKTKILPISIAIFLFKIMFNWNWKNVIMEPECLFVFCA